MSVIQFSQVLSVAVEAGILLHKVLLCRYVRHTWSHFFLFGIHGTISEREVCYFSYKLLIKQLSKNKVQLIFH